MINKLVIQSIIDKYYLSINESVKWEIKDKEITIKFMSPTKDLIGKVTCNNFELEDCELAIYDTKKLSNLIGICMGDLLLEPEQTKGLYTKLKIADDCFSVVYALSDPLLISKVGTVNVPEWIVELTVSSEDILNLVKAKNALVGIDNMVIMTSTDPDGNDICEFIFGDESGHNNKITYQIPGLIKEKDIRIPFNSDIFKTILHSNRDMDTAKLLISRMGLMKLEFISTNINSEYYLVRKAETTF